eukprot:c28861_g1_i1 orf=602-2725(+)
MKMICTCSGESFKRDGHSLFIMATEERTSSGLSSKTIEGETKLDEGNIEEAESSLREALSLNNEEARALLGRLEYQKGNVEAALQVFDGIDISTIVPRMKASIASKTHHRRGRSRTDSTQRISLHAASLLLEAVYLKSKSLQKLGRPVEAAQECKSVLDTVEAVFPQGMSESLGESKLQETVSKSVELLPELWKEAGLFQEAMSSYRRALLSHWNLNPDCCARIQKQFAVLLLYGGVEAGAPSLAAQIEGSFIPKNNLEEAILLLMILLRKCSLRKLSWDSTIMEHLSYALSLCGQSAVLGKKFEEVLPGMYNRADRWYNLALCYGGAGEKKVALNAVRKCLLPVERPNDLHCLLLAAKICAEDSSLAKEAVQYAQRAVDNANNDAESMKCAALHILGVALGRLARVSSSNSERSRLQAEALKSLQEAALLDGEDPELYFDLGLENAEQRNLMAALDCAKKFLDLTSGSLVKGWRLLVLILSAQQRYSEAEVILDAALDETGKWEQGELLRTKAKLQVAQGLSMRAIETYRLLLALVQAQRKSFGAVTWRGKAGEEKMLEVEVWQDLAGVYTTLAQFHDAEVCLEKARALKLFSASTWQATGLLHEARGELHEAMVVYNNALVVDPDHVPSKISMGSLLRRTGGQSLIVARSFLTDALKTEPTNHVAWYNLGMVHKVAGRASEAADCFQAAFVLEQSAPVEKFSSLY